MKALITKACKHLSLFITAAILVMLSALPAYAQLPVITSVSPASGAVGDTITIGGTGFNTTAANNIVYFGATRGIVVAASGGTSLSVKIDTGATHGVISVLNTASHLSGYSSRPFRMTFPFSYFIPGRINLKPKVDFGAGSGAPNPYIAAIGDIDGDGKSDLVVNDRGDTATAGTVLIYRNISTPGTINTGSFTAALTIAIGTVLPSNVKLADFDADGKLDMVLSDQGAGKISVYKNTSTPGSVSFGSAVEFNFGTSGAGPNVLAVADYDGDGWIDVAFSASYANNIVVARNNGIFGSITTGTFGTGSTYAVGVYPIGITAGDFDGDGRPDIAVACSTSNVVSVIPNTSSAGSISFGTRINFTTGGTPIDLQNSDIDGDNKLDLIYSNNADSNISVIRNISTGASIINFSGRVNFRTGAAPVGIGLGDLDGDGKVDLAVTNPGSYPFSLSLLRNTSASGGVSFAARDSFIAGGAAYGVTIGDLDGDGYPDLVTANPYYFQTISVIRNYPLPYVDTISASGPTTLCASGGTVTLGNTVTGGTWISSNNSIATVSATGIVHAVAAGIDTIFYRVIAGGDTNSARRIITVQPVINPGVITGTSVICLSTTTTLADTATGGTWSSSNASIATVTSGGIVRGNALGSATISYTFTNVCGTVAATKNITVSSGAFAGGITGTTTVCVGSTTTLSDTVTGGTWSSAATATATVSSAGVVTGVASGTVTISYTITSSCGTATATASVTVNPMPSAGTITGTTTLCESSTTSLADAASGGTWSSSNTAIASVSATGTVTGIAAGTATISYTVTNSCGTASATALVSVNPLPRVSIIGGSHSMCIGAATATLTDSVSGGVWSSSNTAVATINSSTGVVHAVATGTTNISYAVSNSCGVATTSIAFAVDSSTPRIGAITGTAVLCVAATSTLADTSAGGTWTTSNAAIASVNTAGVVRGVSAGTATITYTISNGCGANDTTRTVTINPLPIAGTITGTAVVCVGVNTTLSDTATGGTWSSSNASVASVNTTGVVHGVAAGTATITYHITNSCGSADSLRTVTVNPQPSVGGISGASTVCAGANIPLTNSVSGGTWSSSSASIASVNSAGSVRGVAAGTANITYSVTNSCGTADTFKTITVIATPTAGTISGPSTTCDGTSDTLTTSGTAGGSWTTSASLVASVTTTGIVFGISPGTATISYTVSNSCGSSTATHSVTISPAASSGPVTGSATVCVGATTTLSVAITGGSFTSSNTGIATVSGAGVVGGVATGSVTITYAVTNSCGTAITTKAMTVITTPNPGTVSGASSVCQGSGVTFSDGTAGGTWSSSAASIASVNTTGFVFGVAAGSATISYTVTNTCGNASATHAITVNPLPVAGTVSGTSPLCIGSGTAFTSTGTGGTWSTGNAAVASVDATGNVTGVAAGTTTISYTVSNGCGSVSASRSVSVLAAPVAGTISGSGTVCQGVTVTETGSSSTITSWALSNTNATLGAASGTTIAVRGVNVGLDTLTYTVTNACGTSTSSRKVISVLEAPNAGTIYGPTSVCGNDTTQYLHDTSANAPGTWSSTSSHFDVDFATGNIVTFSAGTGDAYYTVSSAACGTATDTFTLTIRLAPLAGPVDGIGHIFGFDTLCFGRNDTLNNYGYGDYWMSSNTALATVSLTGGIVSTAAAGSVIIYNIDTNSCGADTFAFHLQIKGTPNPGTITGSDTLCAGLTSALTDTVAGGTWTSSATSVASITTAGIVHAVAAGTSTISYAVANECGAAYATKAFHVIGLPDFTSPLNPGACDSQQFNYNPTSSAGGVGFAWTRATVPGITNFAGSGTGSVSEYLDNTTLAPVTVVYQFITTGFGCADTNLVNVLVSPVPHLTSAKADSICSGATLVYIDTESTGPTTAANWSRAAVTGISPASNSGTHIINEPLTNTTIASINVTYVYTLNFNGCRDTESVVVQVSPSPVFPHITTHTPSYVCNGTMYMNFGGDTLATGVRYDWFTSGGASVWATGNTRQYCLVNFTTPGTSYIYLKASLAGSGCVGIDSFGVITSATAAQTPEVIYFNNDFICKDNTVDSYQWGYDDASTLDSTKLDGETNQNYTNFSPDNLHKFYWVITSHNGCLQKSYYRTPTAVMNVNAADQGSMSILPNPTTGTFKLSVAAVSTEKATITVTNSIGQKVKEFIMNTNTSSEVTLDEAAGIYFITADTRNGRVTGRVVLTK